MNLSLRKESTQEEATISVSTQRIIITNIGQFIKSLRAVLGANIIQEIDPALKIAGIQEITQKGWADNKESAKKND